MNSCIGSGHQFIEDTGVIIVGHFSLDGELKKEHYAKKHHDMLIVKGKDALMDELFELLSFPGQTILHLVTSLHSGAG